MLLEHMLPNIYKEDIIGDLFELFTEVLHKEGLQKANSWFWARSLSLIIHLTVLSKLLGVVHNIMEFMLKIVK